MCRAEGEPCGKRRCVENVPRRRARQRLMKAIQAIVRKQEEEGDEDAPQNFEVTLVSTKGVSES